MAYVQHEFNSLQKILANIFHMIQQKGGDSGAYVLLKN